MPSSVAFETSSTLSLDAGWIVMIVLSLLGLSLSQCGSILLMGSAPFGLASYSAYSLVKQPGTEGGPTYQLVIWPSLPLDNSNPFKGIISPHVSDDTRSLLCISLILKQGNNPPALVIKDLDWLRHLAYGFDFKLIHLPNLCPQRSGPRARLGGGGQPLGRTSLTQQRLACGV